MSVFTMRWSLRNLESIHIIQMINSMFNLSKYVNRKSFLKMENGFEDKISSSRDDIFQLTILSLYNLLLTVNGRVSRLIH